MLNSIVFSSLPVLYIMRKDQYRRVHVGRLLIIPNVTPRRKKERTKERKKENKQTNLPPKI